MPSIICTIFDAIIWQYGKATKCRDWANNLTLTLWNSTRMMRRGLLTKCFVSFPSSWLSTGFCEPDVRGRPSCPECSWIDAWDSQTGGLQCNLGELQFNALLIKKLPVFCIQALLFFTQLKNICLTFSYPCLVYSRWRRWCGATTTRWSSWVTMSCLLSKSFPLTSLDSLST